MNNPHPTKYLTFSLVTIAFVFFQLTTWVSAQSSPGKDSNIQNGGVSSITRSEKNISEVPDEEIVETNASPEMVSAEAARRLTLLSDTYLSSTFIDFVEQVKDGQAETIRGVYVEGVLALPVVQQPDGDSAYVSTELGTATQFRSAEKKGVTGILAHNYLSGILFYDLVPGQEVNIIYGDGSIRRYQIVSSHQFQKLTPGSLQSDYIDLSTGEQMTTREVFTRFYNGGDHVTFQTCLERDGNSSWGLTFTIAEPIDL